MSTLRKDTFFISCLFFSSNRMAAEKSNLEVKIKSYKTQLSLATRRSLIAQVGVVSWFFSPLILGIGDATSLSSFLHLSGSYVKVLAGPGLGLWKRLGVNYSTTTLRKGHNFTCWTVCCFTRAFFQRSELHIWPPLIQKPKPGPGNSIILLQRVSKKQERKSL